MEGGLPGGGGTGNLCSRGKASSQAEGGRPRAQKWIQAGEAGAGFGGVGAREAGERPAWASAATATSACAKHREPTESRACSRWPMGAWVLPPSSSFSLGFESGGRQTAHILKGEIISLLPVLGKIIRSQKCLLVTPFVERHFGTTRWKNQNAFCKMICVKHAS